MAEILTIAERRISGTGLILPTSAQLNYRRYTLFADIIRKPKTPYINTNSNPNETYYGVISLMRSDYVVQTYPIKYDSQIWYFDADITGQVINTIKCEYAGVLQSFANLGTALGLTVTSVVNAIADFKNLPLEWDSIRVKCFADSAIQFVLKGQEYDACSPADQVPREPAAVPTKPETVDPGVATDISDPYPGDTITDPAAIDNVPPESVDGTWLLTWNDAMGGTPSGNYAGKSTDTFILRSPGSNCSLSGSSELVRLPDEVILDPAFNCNNNGFVSTLLSATFTPDP